MWEERREIYDEGQEGGQHKNEHVKHTGIRTRMRCITPPPTTATTTTAVQIPRYYTSTQLTRRTLAGPRRAPCSRQSRASRRRGLGARTCPR